MIACMEGKKAFTLEEVAYLCEIVQKETRQECEKEKAKQADSSFELIAEKDKEIIEMADEIEDIKQEERNRITEEVKKLIGKYPRFDEYFKIELFKIIDPKGQDRIIGDGKLIEEENKIIKESFKECPPSKGEDGDERFCFETDRLRIAIQKTRQECEKECKACGEINGNHVKDLQKFERNRIIKKIEEEKKMWLRRIKRGIKSGLWVYVIKCESRVAMLSDITDNIKEGVEND